MRQPSTIEMYKREEEKETNNYHHHNHYRRLDNPMVMMMRIKNIKENETSYNRMMENQINRIEYEKKQKIRRNQEQDYIMMRMGLKKSSTIRKRREEINKEIDMMENTRNIRRKKKNEEIERQAQELFRNQEYIKAIPYFEETLEQYKNEYEKHRTRLKLRGRIGELHYQIGYCMVHNVEGNTQRDDWWRCKAYDQFQESRKYGVVVPPPEAVLLKVKDPYEELISEEEDEEDEEQMKD
mmetsp:Transcript_11296/g.16717  ORF Transcript_11296/g.16717 Transcript_11296/m.16717 type:complete len:239 (+) Transcript_11296:61-777(+)